MARTPALPMMETSTCKGQVMIARAAFAEAGNAVTCPWPDSTTCATRIAIVRGRMELESCWHAVNLGLTFVGVVVVAPSVQAKTALEPVQTPRYVFPVSPVVLVV